MQDGAPQHQNVSPLQPWPGRTPYIECPALKQGRCFDCLKQKRVAPGQALAHLKLITVYCLTPNADIFIIHFFSIRCPVREAFKESPINA
jgi:hypothetical protein